MRRGNIEAERARRDITQHMMCKMLKISTDSYNRYVNKGEPIPSDKLEKMAQIFDQHVGSVHGISHHNPQDTSAAAILCKVGGVITCQNCLYFILTLD